MTSAKASYPETAPRIALGGFSGSKSAAEFGCFERNSGRRQADFLKSADQVSGQPGARRMRAPSSEKAPTLDTAG
jgi:hypothetical protein